MQKLQILVPEPVLRRLREMAKKEDRPVSEIIRRAVDAWIEKTEPPADRQQGTRIPTFHGGRIMVRAGDMRNIAHQDRAE
jgi:metal-responsive CopG/Arc/MetJ family transcriptional regulator